MHLLSADIAIVEVVWYPKIHTRAYAGKPYLSEVGVVGWGVRH